jgi:hypothetical protein
VTCGYVASPRMVAGPVAERFRALYVRNLSGSVGSVGWQYAGGVLIWFPPLGISRVQFAQPLKRKKTIAYSEHNKYC